jgi:spermidine synthase
VQRALILAAACTAGAATMIVELAAVRLLAPWFGTSLPVWTNVLVVILLGLAVGYALGGRWSRGRAPLLLSAGVLAIGAVLAAALPWLAPPVAGWFLPAGTTLESARPLLTWGSLAASLMLFLPPAIALGVVAPLWLETLTRAGHPGGSTNGLLACVSTLGSLAGSFACTHWFVPGFGLQATFRIAGAALLVAAGLLAWSERRKLSKGVALGLAVAAVGAQMLEAARPAPARGLRVLEARETDYQSARIVEDPGSGYRYLQVNEGFDSFQSVWSARPGPLGEGYYYDLFALPCWWAPPAARSVRLLVLGAGTASAARVLDGALPDGRVLEATLVELDRQVVELGARWMDAVAPGRRWLAGHDARTALALLSESYDQIIVDAYANQIEIPPHLCSREFFELAAGRLVPGGWLVLNVGGFGFEDPVVAAVAATLASACGPRVLALRVPAARNVVLVARRDAELPRPGSAEFRPAQGAPAELRVLAGRLELTGAWRLLGAGVGPVLTDDHNPIETLQQLALARGRSRQQERAR